MKMAIYSITASIFLFPFFAFAQVGAGQSQSNVELLQEGSFAGKHVTAESGGEWFGLYRVGEDGFELRKTRVDIVAVRDYIMGDGENEKTGRKVVGEFADETPLFLARGLDALSEGKVKSAYDGKAFLYPGQHTFLRFEEGVYIYLLALGEAVNPNEHPTSVWFKNYRFQLSYSRTPHLETIKQTLAEHEMIDIEHPPHLVWAGDIDRDGKIDLLMDLTDSYGKTQLTLLLSSFAKEGGLVGKAADFIWFCC